MKTKLNLFTKFVLDFMFFSGIGICILVPVIFKFIGRYYENIRNFYIPMCILFMITGAFAILIIYELRKMFRTVIREDPFVVDNVNSLKKMGKYSFVIAAVTAIRLFFVLTPATFIIIIVFFIAGLFSFVLSQVFDQAVTYKIENDFTI